MIPFQRPFILFTLLQRTIFPVQILPKREQEKKVGYLNIK